MLRHEELLEEEGEDQQRDHEDHEDDLRLCPPERVSPLVTVEPVAFLVFFAINLSVSIYTNNLLFQTCVYTLKQDREVCQYLGTANESTVIVELEAQAEKYSADILMVSSILGVIPAFWSFFLGPWSDKHGRKPILLVTVCGFTVQFLIISIIASLSRTIEISPWWYLLSNVPLILTGGYCSMITVMFCFITDITQESNRSTRMIALETYLYVGLFLGSLSSSQILNYLTADMVFLICAGFCLLAVFYTMIFIKESVAVRVQQDPVAKLQDLFRINHLNDMIEAALRRRPDFCRLILWLLFCSMSLIMFIMEGSSTVFFLFVRERFGWTVHDYALYDSMSIFVQVAGTIIGIYGLKKLCGISDAMMAVIASAAYVLDGVTKSVAHLPAHLYLAIGLSMFRSILSPMCRSSISLIVANDEIGKLFALITSLESLTPLIASPIYTKLYKATLTTFPNAFNILSASLGLVCTLIMTTVYVLFQGLPQLTYGSISS